MITKRILTIIVFAGVFVPVLRAKPAAAQSPMRETPVGVKELHDPAAGTSVLSIPAAAFSPSVDGYDFDNYGVFLCHYHSSGGGTDNGFYYAPVNLPHGAVVTKFTFYWYDDSSANAVATLRRSELLTGDEDEMASAATAGTPGVDSSSDDFIDYVGINNSLFTYWVVWELPVTDSSLKDLVGYSVSIEYTPPATNTGLLSIPAAAFTPFEDGYDYRNYGDYLVHDHSPGGGFNRGWYYAPVELPHGAVVTRFLFYWSDTAAADGTAILQRTQLSLGDYGNMASAVTAGSLGNGWTEDNSISYQNINNTLNAYWVVWDLPYIFDILKPIGGRGVAIEYTLPVTETGVLSIPAAAFTPSEDGLDYQNDGRFLRHFHSPGGGDGARGYHAPVYLPQGATVTSMTFYWYDASTAADGSARLRGDIKNDGVEFMTEVYTTGSSEYGSTTINSIDYATVDNSQHAYRIEWALPAVEYVKGCGVVIEYEYRLYLPITTK